MCVRVYVCAFVCVCVYVCVCVFAHLCVIFLSCNNGLTCIPQMYIITSTLANIIHKKVYDTMFERFCGYSSFYSDYFIFD